MKSIILSACLALFCAAAANAWTITGAVKDSSGNAAANVKVAIPTLGIGTKTDASGVYKIENVPSGSYAVKFTQEDSTAETKKADVNADTVLDVALSAAPLSLAPITISAAPKPRSTLTTPASVSVVEGKELQKEQSQSVITAIQDQPGVNMISEGPTVVKPEIRGLNSEDIVVVQDGVRSESLQWGSEHAPEVDSLSASRIEVLRGPNSLMYGSDALGGVISINHPDLPNAKMGDSPLSGSIVADAHSVNQSIGESVMLQGAQNDWGWRANISQRQSGNYNNPLQGEVPNTGENELSGDGAAGVREDWGALSFDFGHFYKRVELQNPSNPWPATMDDDEYQVLNHDHGVIKATYNTDLHGVETLDSTMGYDRADRSEYDHQSDQNADGDLVNDSTTTPHLHWLETSYTEELKAHLDPMGAFQGTLGLSGLLRDEQAMGVTHLTPSYHENNLGEYLFEEASSGKLDVSFGARADQSHYQVAQDDMIGIDPDINLNDPHPVAAQTLNYSAVSGALGGVYHVSEPFAVAVNIGRGFRNPTPFELFAYGEHEGTHQFLIGNPGLSPETSLNTDLSLRWSSDKVKGEGGVFRNSIHDYIYSTYTDLPDPSGQGLPVVQSAQTDATLWGADYVVTYAPEKWLTLKSVGNLVRGENTSSDSTLPSHWLPHVPADNVLFGARVQQKRMGALYNPYIGADVKFTAAQNRVGPEEIPSSAYTLVNLKLGAELPAFNERLSIDAGVDNLFNKGYIDFNSILKEYGIEDPGRNIHVRVSVPLGS